MADKTLYDILEVSSSATPEAIRAAYERLSVKYDPDRPENAASADARILHTAVKDAFLTLGNATKRAQYDKSLAASQPRPYNVEVVEPFWTLPKMLVVAILVVGGSGYYYKHQKEVARLEAEKAIAAAKAREAEELAKAEAEQARQAAMQLQRERQEQIAEERQRRERDIALSRFTAEQRAQMRQSEVAALRERQEAQRQQQQRQREEMMAAREAQQRAAKERMELCRLERERYGTSTSCNY